MRKEVTFQYQKARQCVVRHNVSFAEFADACQINSGHLSLLLNGKRQPSAPIRRRLLKGLSAITGSEWHFDDLFEVVGKSTS